MNTQNIWKGLKLHSIWKGLIRKNDRVCYNEDNKGQHIAL